MVRRRQWTNLVVFALLAGVALWWVARNWGQTAAGGAARVPVTAPVAGTITAGKTTETAGAGTTAAAAADGTLLPPMATFTAGARGATVKTGATRHTASAKAGTGASARPATRTTAAGLPSGAATLSKAATHVAATTAAGKALPSGNVAGVAGRAATGTTSMTRSGGLGSSALGAKGLVGPKTASAADYFAAARLERAQAESRELDQLEAMADDAGAAATIRAEAEQEILQLDTQQRAESTAEMVLKAKGFTQAIVLLQASGAVVVVEAPHFNAAAAAAVAQVVAGAAGIAPDQVQIVVRP